MNPDDIRLYAHARLSALIERAENEIGERDKQYLLEELLDDLHVLRTEIDPTRKDH